MLASFSSQHLESHLHDPGNPLYDSITKNDALGDLSLDHLVVLYVGFIDDALVAVGGSTALEDMGDEFTAAALTDALFDGKDPAPAETIQRAINRVLEPGISNDGLLGEQTFAAYRTLAKDSAARNQLLDVGLELPV